MGIKLIASSRRVMHASIFQRSCSAAHIQQREYHHAPRGYFHPRSKHYCDPHQSRPKMRAPARAALPQPLSDFAEGPLSDIVSVTLTGGIIAGIGWSLLPLLSGRAQEKRQKQITSGEGLEEDEGVQWGVMGVLSFIPFINWTGWVFAALESDSPAGYYGLAALYALPWVKGGLQLDTFTVCCLLAGAVHIQIERIAATEPDTVPTASSSAITDAADTGRKILMNSTKAFKDVVEESALERRGDAEEVTSKNKVRQLEKGSKELLQSEENEAAKQMRQWDERLSASRDDDEE